MASGSRTVKKPMSDTAPEVDRILVEGYRRMTPAEKLAQVCSLNRSLERLALAGLRARLGDRVPELELRLRLAALRLDRETMVRVFAWDPAREGY